MREIELKHEGLHAYRKVRGATQEEVQTKARLQFAAWDARWSRLQERDKSRQLRLAKRGIADRQADVDRRAREHAVELTKDAEAAVGKVRSLLGQALTDNHKFKWEALLDTSVFEKSSPPNPILESVPNEPWTNQPEFQAAPVIPTFTWLDWLLPGARKKKIGDAEAQTLARTASAKHRFDEVHAEWKRQVEQITRRNQSRLADHKKQKAAWILEKKTFGEQQVLFNNGIDDFKRAYLARNPQALVRYWTEVLSRSEYPDSFPRESEMSFDLQKRMLVLDYEMPSQKALPTVKQVKYVSNRREFSEVPISDTEFRRLYDDALYQICLRTLFELFKADDIDILRTIVFNGWVQAVDKATGSNTHPCIMTVQVDKAEFLALNLQQVDLKACFRSLKGVSGSKLVDSSPVRPVLTLNREDPRFVAPKDVAESLNDKTNLAAMDWLDFENLIRELFEKEFSRNGGEVKITQASRDGGVDAIAFDPDPIRGGKIVIQAKRYTNTVGVAAVRDLFGTIHNEGATKGILVTTSDYGPDAYEFAKGKPLTLLTGGELLYLLAKHGYHAKIDLSEAKKLLGDN